MGIDHVATAKNLIIFISVKFFLLKFYSLVCSHFILFSSPATADSFANNIIGDTIITIIKANPQFNIGHFWSNDGNDVDDDDDVDLNSEGVDIFFKLILDLCK